MKSEKQEMFCSGKFILEATFLLLKTHLFFLCAFFFVENDCGGESESYGKNNHSEMTTKPTLSRSGDKFQHC